MNIGLRYEYTPWLEGYLGQLGTFNPALVQPIIVAGHTNAVNLTSQYAAPAAYQFFGQYIQTTSAVGLPYNLTYTDLLQLGPRVGFAWRPFGNRTVIRGGFGMYYEPERSGGRVNRNILPFLLSETVNQTANVVPNRTLGNFFLGSLLGSALPNPTINPTLTHLKMGQYNHFSLAVQEEITPKTLFEVAWVGNNTLHLQATDDFNDPTPGAGAVQGRRPYQPWGTISMESQDMGATYESLQTKLEHRTGNGLTGLVSYTWSKMEQEAQTPAVGGNLGYEHTYSPYNVPQNLAISGTYEIPVGHGRAFLNKSNGFVDAMLGGWQTQTIIVLRSGVPYTPGVGSDVANTGVGSQRPNLNPAGGSPTFQKSLTKWFDPTGYVAAPQYTYGTVKANTLESDLHRQYDASFFKNFHLPGESVLSFRAEAFNISNTTSFSAPGATITSSSCCAVTSTSVPSRDIQFALKYDF